MKFESIDLHIFYQEINYNKLERLCVGGGRGGKGVIRLQTRGILERCLDYFIFFTRYYPERSFCTAIQFHIGNKHYIFTFKWKIYNIFKRKILVSLILQNKKKNSFTTLIRKTTVQKLRFLTG
jgi:hypothetical protein